ncbi:unnamed protein product [Schistosoma margrebowiei]|uniref:Uncharacterized protein n=1 Tax=Schistosoma margrebowiei TaxID=48269 RepID=A0A183MU86_9TREM|nr:unnamed protein product [Schistosoma margrebowiei]
MSDFSASAGILSDPTVFPFLICLMTMVISSVVGGVTSIGRSIGAALMFGGFNEVGLFKSSSKLPFPSDWRSLQDDQLCAMTGISGCIFVHNCGHLGSNKTRDGAIEMARFVVNESKLQQGNVIRTALTPPKFSRGRGRKSSVNNRNKKC